MKNNDIGLLKYCFSVFSQKNQKKTREWIQKAEKCLRRAGTQEVKADYEKEELYFGIRIDSDTEKKYDLQYKMKPVPGGRQILLEQEVFWQKENGAYRLMRWYADKRNESLPKEMRYSLTPVHLETRISLRNNWEIDLIRKTGDMNHIILEDHEIFEMLSRGEIPEKVKRQVQQEYREYEREISHGISV